MAEGLNRVMLLGNLGADPELRVTPGGQAVLRLRLATNETYVDRNNVRQERTEWHRVTVWGKRAEGLGKILHKGDVIFVDGRLQTSSYEKNGEKRYSTDIVASNILLTGTGRGRSESPASGIETGAVGATSASSRGREPSEFAGGPAGAQPRGGRASRDAPEAPFDDFAEPAGGSFGSGGGSDDDIPF